MDVIHKYKLLETIGIGELYRERIKSEMKEDRK